MHMRDDVINRLCYLTILPILQSLALTPLSNLDHVEPSSAASEKKNWNINILFFSNNQKSSDLTDMRQIW